MELKMAGLVDVTRAPRQASDNGRAASHLAVAACRLTVARVILLADVG